VPPLDHESAVAVAELVAAGAAEHDPDCLGIAIPLDPQRPVTAAVTEFRLLLVAHPGLSFLSGEFEPKGGPGVRQVLSAQLPGRLAG